MKNKSGFLLAEETLKIIIAIICIIFLVYLLASLYFSGKDDEKIEHAKAILKESDQSFEKIINKLSEGESKELSVQNPEGWYLFSFLGKEKPNSCAGQNCLCICNKLWNIEFWNSQAEECNEEGVCLIVPQLAEFNSIEIKKGLSPVLIKKEKGRILIKEQ